MIVKQLLQKVVETNEGPIYKNKFIVRRVALQSTDIKAVLESFDSRGRIHKNRCFIYHQDLGSVLIKEKFTTMCPMVEQSKIKGYK